MRIIFRLLAVFGLIAALASCGPGGKFRHYEGPPVTQIQVFKAKRVMVLFSGNKILKTYKVALGNSPVGPKKFEGDGKTPEGAYYITHHNPNSAYHLSLGVSYPSISDAAYATAFGMNAGGDIMIHGRAGKDKGRPKDWTAGCIAVKDKEIEEIYAMVTPGTPIIIFP